MLIINNLVWNSYLWWGKLWEKNSLILIISLLPQIHLQWYQLVCKNVYLVILEPFLMAQTVRNLPTM